MPTTAGNKRAVATPKLKEARRSVGALLGFYRRIRALSQKELANKAKKITGRKITASTVAMAESGLGLPRLETLAAISTALGLDRFQTRQLEALVEHPRRASKPGDEWFLPDDVLTGIPLFLRNLTRESVFQREASMTEMWIVTDRPLALGGEMRAMLKKRIFSDKTVFVYFLDSTIGEAPFQTLWSGLCMESPAHRKSITERLQCVLTPASLCLHHYGICNPGAKSEDMFGRSVFYSRGLPVGFAAMDSHQVDRAYRLLDQAYQDCKASPGKDVITEWGTFRLVKPRLGA
jgi:transcriptional regulator with XRE-family HTH domain